VDARDRLRLYLEQRRELGETELLLDTLPVEDVLALLGVGDRGTSGAASSGPVRRAAPAPGGGGAPPGAPAPRAAGAAGSPEPMIADTIVAPPDAAAADARPAPRDGDGVPPAPVLRFDASASDRDWRAQLRSPVADGSVPVAPAAAAEAPAPAARPDPDAPPAAERARPADAPPDWLAALGLPIGLSVGDRLPVPPPGRTLGDIAQAIAACTACALAGTARHPVPGEGRPDAEFVCVGEAPGQTEDETGQPFVGAAGQLLTRILAAIQFARDDVYICNVLKHRPPNNRTPLPDEVRACRPFLEQQLALLRPRVILALGTSAAHALLDTTQSLGALRGRLHRYHGIPVIVTYHPAALLRNEAWKRPTWADVQLARRIHDAARAVSPA
jgi:uracil-DNA glycosylase family 4